MIDDECAPRGYMIVLRALWESKLFRPGAFTEREAFFWMMNEAAYAEHRSWINGIGFDLRRGQFVHGCAFMAKAWNWMTPKGKPNEKLVERFLKRLAKDGIIAMNPNKGFNVTTICDYDKLQLTPGYNETRARRESVGPDGERMPRPKRTNAHLPAVLCRTPGDNYNPVNKVNTVNPRNPVNTGNPVNAVNPSNQINAQIAVKDPDLAFVREDSDSPGGKEISSRDDDNIIPFPLGRDSVFPAVEGIHFTAESNPATPAVNGRIPIPGNDNDLLAMQDFILRAKSKLGMVGARGADIPIKVAEATGNDLPAAEKIIEGAAAKPQHERSAYLEREIRRARNIRNREPGTGGDWPADYEDQFWTAYPRQIGKEPAMEELRRLREEGASFTIVVMGAERYSSETKQTEERFIKHPANWLREGSWSKHSERVCA